MKERLKRLIESITMLKYIDTKVTFSEVPDEIALCINISNCPNNCEGCHSPWLAKDEGTELTYNEVKELYHKNKGVTCICFMGGDSDPKTIKDIATLLSVYYPQLKTAWYSGKNTIEELDLDLADWNYIKVGPYIKDRGPLNNPSTNQRFYEIQYNNGTLKPVDITHKFWKDD